VTVDADRNGLDDLYRSYIGVGDTAVGVADFRIRDMLPAAVVEDIVGLTEHRAREIDEVAENREYLSGNPCGWHWSLANSGADRSFAIRRELDGSGEREDRPIETRPGFFDADCLSIVAGSVTFLDELGWVVAYTGSRWIDDDGEKLTQFGTGILVLDLNLPERVLYRSEEPISGGAGVTPGWVRVSPEATVAHAEQLIPARVREEIARLYRLNPMPSDMVRWLEQKSRAVTGA
jgi:hypothetical protein